MRRDTLSVQEALKAEEVIVLPTDTVYGLVVLATSPSAVKRLYEVKDRKGKPGTIIAASVEQLRELGFQEEDVEKAKRYWPGAVSIVLPAPATLSYLHMGLESLAVRVTADIELLELLKLTGPLATTSANRPGEPTATTVEEAEAIFGDTVSLYVDGGRVQAAPSTIYKLESNIFTKIR
jgi:tRNA threonylcarbamoyl adenosine modification protein (Sua5/YciO/YrdC/YwlC family)